MRIDDVRRILLGTFVRPAAETADHTERIEAVYGYLIRTDQTTVLFDTGLGEADAETELHYRPRRIALDSALNEAGTSVDDIDAVINCHLHFDHIGNNPKFAGRPLYCQRRELDVAQATTNYTVPELVDFRDARYELLDGETTIAPGLHVIPTPGHTEGHQSLVVECEDGTIVVAGQAHDTASQWSSDALAARASTLGHVAPLPKPSPWMDRLLAFDPKRIVFAHDAAVWEP